MKLFIRKDGRFDIELRGMTQLVCDKTMAVRILKEFKISSRELDKALTTKNYGDNVLHFGDLNKSFMFSTYEHEEDVVEKQYNN